MMAATLFCQDVREEVGGILSLMGIFPDNVNIDAVGPGDTALSKLVIYTRINLPLDAADSSLIITLRGPDGEEVVRNEIERAFVKKTVAEARAKGNLLVGFVARVDGSPFPVKQGRYCVSVQFANVEQISGSINFEITRR